MKKLLTILSFALLLTSCATTARYFGVYTTTPYIGMSESEFRKAAPFVYTVNVTRTAGGTYKQYVFQDHVSPRYVYFENGVLTAWQN